MRARTSSGTNFELSLEHVDPPILVNGGLCHSSDGTQGVEIGWENVVIVSVDGHGTVGQISSLTALPGSEQRPAEHVVDAFAVWLTLNGFLGVAAGFLILPFREGKASVSYEQFWQVRLQ